MNLDACQEFLLSLALRSTVLAGLVWMALLLCRRRSAAFRCTLISAGMVALALLPLSWCLPRVEVPYLPAWVDGSPPQAQAFVEPTASPACSQALPLLWFLGIGGLAFLHSAGVWRLQSWREGSQALESGCWLAFIREVSETLGYRGNVRLYRCPLLHSPAAAGLAWPCVFLPADALSWDRERLRLVLLHEIGHLKRRDLWTQWLSQAVCALYWFHPLVWALHRQLHQTREFACDHTVLSTGTEPGRYARELLSLAKNLREVPPSSRLIAANGLFLGMAPSDSRQSMLEARVRAILSFQHSRSVSLALAGMLTILSLSLSWATATWSPSSSPSSPTSDSSETAKLPMGPGGSPESQMIPPVEVHLRLAADPFPGNP